jgi:N-methylhydantoinase A/oxoprolinase/acetone carboxylase beta subunit
VHLDGRWQEVPVTARDGLAVGARVEGPALVVQPTATTVLEAGDVLTVDGTGHMLITWERA